jgi:hypothetical protein
MSSQLIGTIGQTLVSASGRIVDIPTAVAAVCYLRQIRHPSPVQRPTDKLSYETLSVGMLTPIRMRRFSVARISRTTAHQLNSVTLSRWNRNSRRHLFTQMNLRSTGAPKVTFSKLLQAAPNYLARPVRAGGVRLWKLLQFRPEACPGALLTDSLCKNSAC